MESSSLSRPHCFHREGDVSTCPSLSELEFEALRDLDESISYFEENNEHFLDELDHDESQKSVEPGALFSLHRAQMFSEPKHANAGYIIFDGTKMQYVRNDASPTMLNRMTALDNAGLDESLESNTSSFARPVSERQRHLNISSEDLLAEDFLRSYTSPIAPTAVNRRFPACAFLSCVQKFCMFVTGTATVSAFSAFYISLAYLTELLGDSVLSSVALCHFIPSLLVMTLVFCSKKRLWVPFLPTVPLCLAFMAAIVAAVPATAAAGVQLPTIAILGMLTLNGLCSGMSDSLVSRMVVLFPGGKCSRLVTYGRGLGSLIPAVIQMVLILSQGLEPEDSAQRSYKKFCLFGLFPLVFLVILTGLLSLLKFSKSGIYELFAGKDCAAHSPKNITIGTVPDTAKRRFRRTRSYLLAEFLVAAVSFYVLSLAPQVHGAALNTENSTFWRHYLGTVLVGLFKFGDWFGEVVGLFSSHRKTSFTRCFLVLCLTLSILRLGFVATAMVFIRQPSPVYHNILAMTVFFLLGLSNGYLTVAMVTHCQSLCGVRARETCPIVSQLICLSVYLGSAVGTALSFVPIR